MIHTFRYGFVIFMLLLISNASFSITPIIIDSKSAKYSIGSNIEILTDPNSEFDLSSVVHSKDFKPSDQDVPNLNISSSTHWVKFKVVNKLENENLLLNLSYPIIDTVKLFYLQDDELTIVKSGESVPITKRQYFHQNFLFDLKIKPGESKTYFFKIKSNEQIMLPLYLGSPNAMLQSNATLDLFNGLYFGIVMVMLFYNLFLYFSVKDKSYLFYVIYILIIGMTQATDTGYAYRLLWPNSPIIANFMVTLLPALVGIAAILFLRDFLNIKKHLPKSDIIFKLFIGLYSLSAAFHVFGFTMISYQFSLIIAFSISLYMFAVAYKMMRKGSRPARFFLIAWTIFLSSVCIFVLKDFGIIPYNNLTKHILQIGSSIELVLLSFALADRINILKKEKEDAQQNELNVLQENKNIVEQQNVILESKVKERTQALEQSNEYLSKAITDLKQAQSQLVDAEKMASLGQLTAGIAHEINNPINFVVSNINPLKRDINDILQILEKYAEIKDEENLAEKLEEIEALKEELDMQFTLDEIDQLLKGINEGADRTVEIVKSLRTFSRLDENDLKKADINNCLESTLLLLNSALKEKVEIQQHLADLPLIECYPGKINQLFMNILNNAVHAIGEKKYAENEKGLITLVTEDAAEDVIIKIKDNGTGMDETTRNRIFEPFFTTKDVGEGTGLGLSIVHTIVKKHHAHLELKTELGKGTEFTIRLPKIQRYKNQDTQKQDLETYKQERRSNLLNKQSSMRKKTE